MPRSRGRINVDLFPFLSVLCSVIGVMMLMMMFVMSTRVIEATPPQPATQPPGRPGVEDGVDARTYAELEQEVARLEADLGERLQRRDELARSYQELLAALDEKRTQLDVPDLAGPRKPIELDAGIPVEVKEDPDHVVDKQPIFVEVRAEGYLVHPAREAFPPVKPGEGDALGTYVASPDLLRFLRSVSRESKDQYLVLLIHPNGTKAFDYLRSYIQSRGYLDNPDAARGGEIELGWEPFSRDWEIIISQEN